MKARVLLACTLLGLGACAGQPAAPDVADAADKAGKATEEPKDCLRETGTKIKRRADNRCVDAPGKVYTAEDIERTGAQTIGEVLKRLGH